MKKDKTWLKEELLEELMQFNDNPNMRTVYETGIVDGIMTAINLIEKLDEQGVEEKVYTFDNAKKWLQENGFVVFEKDNLYSEVQQMISETYKAKKDRPVIPKFVAEWFEYDKRDMEIEDVFWQIENCEMVKLDVDRWITDNKNTFIRAWLDGYEVEKEKKYHVVNKENYFMLRKYDGLVDTFHVSPSMSRDEYGKDTRFMLTEKEIKDYDERFWAFAEEVIE